MPVTLYDDSYIVADDAFQLLLVGVGWMVAPGVLRVQQLAVFV